VQAPGNPATDAGSDPVNRKRVRACPARDPQDLSSCGKEIDVRRRWVPAVMLAAVALVVVGPASAGSKGRRNTAAVLGAAAAYEAMQGRGTNGLVLGAGAVGAYGRYRDARKEEDRYYDRYDRRYDRYDDRRYDSRDRVRGHRERERYDRYEDCDERDYRDDRGRSRGRRGYKSGGRYYLDRD
jgi:hypothetical protein